MKDNFKRIAIIASSAMALMFMVKMCKSDGLSEIYKKDHEEIQHLGELQNKSDSLLKEVLHDLDTKQHQYGDEIDSLNGIILNDNLTQEEFDKLKKKIKKTEKLLKEANEKEVLIVEPTMNIEPIISVNIKDSVIWNIIEKDTIIYNIIERDTVIYKTVRVNL
jgi:hypothetical protein